MARRLKKDNPLRNRRSQATAPNMSVTEVDRDELGLPANETDRQKVALSNLDRLLRASRTRVGPRKWTRQDLYER
jgi:hypothetical protein